MFAPIATICTRSVIVRHYSSEATEVHKTKAHCQKSTGQKGAVTKACKT